jgi:DNA-binding XRE family transcriptional regulator
MASAPNVLRQPNGGEQSFEPTAVLFGRVSNRDYRAAVAQIVRELKAERGYSNERLAEIAGCSEGTIFNAENENGNLDPVILLNIALPHGGERRLRRVLSLINGNPEKPLTTEDRLDRIEREVAAIRKERTI